MTTRHPPALLVRMVLTLQAAAGCAATPAAADSIAANSQGFALHLQSTVVDQANLAFTAPYSGPNSLPPIAEGRETLDVTLFAGVRPWSGGEIWVDPEMDQGFGLHDTLGVAGFPSGEAYKVGSAAPYARIQRLFLRQTIDLGGKLSPIDADLNQLAGRQTADRLVITLGKFNVTDIFDTNTYAHDPRRDFLNWALIDAGTFDYAADAWGYTVGGAAELYRDNWVARAGVFALSVIPNSPQLDAGFGQFQLDGEIERGLTIAGHAGTLKLTGFLSRGRMARFADALALGEGTGEPPNVALARRYRGRGGVSLDFQQEIAGDVGLFARAGLADGAIEPYEFSDIDRTISGGVSLAGGRWGRPDDRFAVGGAVNAISAIHQQYLADGGLGILVGDGRLPHPGTEDIVETWYDLGLAKPVHLTLDYQLVNNPAYNRDRGPVSVFAARLHAQF